MADDKKITIEIVGVGGKGNGDGENGDGKEQNPNQKLSALINKSIHPFQSLKSAGLNSLKDADNRAGFMVSMGFVEQALGDVESILFYSNERYLNLSEDYLSQNTYNQVKAHYSITKKALSSIASGAARGAMVGGGAGAIVGGLISAASFGVKQSLEISKTMSQAYQQLNATNFNTQYNAKRAGLYDGSRGTES